MQRNSKRPNGVIIAVFSISDQQLIAPTYQVNLQENRLTLQLCRKVVWHRVLVMCCGFILIAERVPSTRGLLLHMTGFSISVNFVSSDGQLISGDNQHDLHVEVWSVPLHHASWQPSVENWGCVTNGNSWRIAVNSGHGDSSRRNALHGHLPRSLKSTGGKDRLDCSNHNQIYTQSSSCSVCYCVRTKMNYGIILSFAVLAGITPTHLNSDSCIILKNEKLSSCSQLSFVLLLEEKCSPILLLYSKRSAPLYPCYCYRCHPQLPCYQFLFCN